MANYTLPQWAIVKNKNAVEPKNAKSFKLSHGVNFTKLKYKLYNPPVEFTQAQNLKKQANLEPSEHSQANIKVYFETPKFTKNLANRYNKTTSDQYRRSRFLGAELERKVLKSLLSSKTKQITSKLQLKHKNQSKLSGKFLHNQSLAFSQLGYNRAVNRKLGIKMNTITRIRNRCVLTSHRNSIGKLGISRIVFRTLAGFGQLPGIKKI